MKFISKIYSKKQVTIVFIKNGTVALYTVHGLSPGRHIVGAYGLLPIKGWTLKTNFCLKLGTSQILLTHRAL